MAFFFLFYVMPAQVFGCARALLYLYVIIYSIYNTYKKGQDDTMEIMRRRDTKYDRDCEELSFVSLRFLWRL